MLRGVGLTGCDLIESICQHVDRLKVLFSKEGSTCSGQSGERVASGAEKGWVIPRFKHVLTSILNQYGSPVNHCKEQ